MKLQTKNTIWQRIQRWLKRPGNSVQLVVSVISVLLLVIAVCSFGNPATDVRPLSDHVSANIWRVVFTAITVMMLVFATRRYQQPKLVADGNDKWLNRLSVILPAIAVVFALIELVWPEFATLLVRKEDWPFMRNAIFVKCSFEIVGVVLMVMTARRYFQHNMKLAGVFAIIIALVLFVMAGEEMSWGQRIFRWDTPESMKGINQQKEMNLHNLATQTFQNTLYFGCWILLIAMPFMRKLLQKILHGIKPLKFLVDWLPPAQFILLFAVGFAFMDPLISKQGSPETGLYYNSNLFIIIGTLIFLLATLIGQFRQHAKQRDVIHTAVVLAIFVGITIFSLFYNRVWSYNSGAATEYLELFIVFGLMMWTVLINRATKRSLR